MLGVGDRIGRYRIVRKIGEGGMGAVFEGLDEAIGRHAAIKVLHARFSQDPQIATRFLNEARASNIVNHPGIVEVFEHGRLDDGTTFIVMQLLKGDPLRKRIEREGGRLPVAEAVRLTRQMASALAAAHACGIIHRDMKPENVFITPDPEAPAGERARVLDFGIAKVREAVQSPSGEVVKTMAGAILGTPVYMAPEQCRGAREVTEKSDVYSLGVMLYEMLAGRPPFSAEGPGELMAMHMLTPPPPLSLAAPDTPEPLAALVHAMLEKDAAKRPAMAEVEQAMQRLGASSTGEHAPISTAATRTTVVGDPGQGQLQPPAQAQGGVPVTGVVVPPVAPAPSGRRWKIVAAISALALVPIGVTGVLLLKGRTKPVITKPQIETPVPPPAPRPIGTSQPEPPRPATPPPGMALIAGGSFRMGSTPDEIARAISYCERLAPPGGCRRDVYERETPARSVRVSPFFLDRTEVTNADYAAWLNRDRNRFQVASSRYVSAGGVLLIDLRTAAEERAKNPSGIAHGGIEVTAEGFRALADEAKRPVVQVTWQGAMRYCADQGKTLPTEAQWEYAARGAGAKGFPWGDGEPACGEVVFDPARKGGDGKITRACPYRPAAAAVATHPRDQSPQGVFDLGGNVSEWTLDRFQERYPICDAPCADPRAGDGTGGVRVVRGGNWGLPAEACRAAGRSRAPSDRVAYNIGFRCARPAKE